MHRPPHPGEVRRQWIPKIIPLNKPAYIRFKGKPKQGWSAVKIRL